jgi:hypothetical protein
MADVNGCFQIDASECSHKNISVIVQSTHYLVTQLLNLSTVKTNIFLQNGERKLFQNIVVIIE